MHYQADALPGIEFSHRYMPSGTGCGIHEAGTGVLPLVVVVIKTISYN